MAHSEPAPGVDDSWWSQPSGAREVLTLALPLALSTASWSVMHFIDRVFLMWHSEAAIAAAMPAGLLNFTVVCFWLGVATYVNTFVAQYYGAGRDERIGLAVWQGVWVGVIALPLMLLTRPLSAWVFAQSGHAASLQQLEVTYYSVLTLGAGAFVISGALSAFFSGRGETRIVMFVNAGQAVLNIGLDYVWIFGKFGFPAWGIGGAAAATVVSEWVKVAVFLCLMFGSRDRVRFGVVQGLRFDEELFRRLFRYGAPNGIQMFVEMGAFSMFIMLVGQLGVRELTATTLAFNINSLAFVPLLGLGVAVSVLVGQQLGANRPDLAARATRVSFVLALSYSLFMGALYVGAPGLFLYPYEAKASSADFAPIRETTIVLLRFVALYCLFDAMNLVFVSAIKGAGDMRFVLITTLIMSPIPVVVGWWGIHHGGWGLISFWVLVTVWICLLGVVYAGRYWQGKWRLMRVIEQAPISQEAIISQVV